MENPPNQGWANYGPGITSGPFVLLIWPAESKVSPTKPTFTKWAEAFYVNGKQASQQETETLENIHDVLFMQLQVSTYKSSSVCSFKEKRFLIYIVLLQLHSLHMYVKTLLDFLFSFLAGCWCAWWWVYHGGVATARMAETDATCLVQSFIPDSVRQPSGQEMMIFSEMVWGVDSCLRMIQVKKLNCNSHLCRIV